MSGDNRLTRRRTLKSIGAASVGGLATAGAGSQTAVEVARAGSDPDMAEGWADEYRYTYDEYDDLEATVNANFGVAQMGKGVVSPNSGGRCTDEDHYYYDFVVYGMGIASAEEPCSDGSVCGVSTANFLKGHKVSLDAKSVCGNGTALEPFESFDWLATSSEGDSLLGRDHYAEDRDLDSHDDVKYWCNKWADDHNDIDRNEDFADWNTAMSSASLAVGIIGGATGGAGWGLAGVTLSAVSVVDSLVADAYRRRYSETNTSFSVSESDDYRPVAMHYVNFRAYVPPYESLEIDVYQDVKVHEQDGSGNELESNIDNDACYEISVPSMSPPSEQDQQYDANVVTCENQREYQ